jgi:predicted O-methyltransferase YrrM
MIQRILKNYLQANNNISEILSAYGYANTIEKQVPVDKLNQPLPWLTYPAIHFISQLNLKDKDVLEWGSGYSSKYFASRCKNVISIENNKDWFDNISKDKSSNQTIILVENTKESYVDVVAKINKKFDIIVIDGQLFRKECAVISKNYLKEGGMIILDNSDWFKSAAKVLYESDLIQVDFHGFGPINNYTWVTSIFFHRKFRMEYLEYQPNYAIGGLYHLVE